MNLQNTKTSELSKKGAIFILIITSIILLIGTVLLGIGLNEAFYSSSEITRDVFSVITLAGDELIFIVLLSFVFFAVNKTYAKKLIYGFMISSYINELFKIAFQDPRPATNLVDGIPVEEGYGFPSGHTQLSVSFWGYTMLSQKHHPRAKVIWIVCISMLVLVPISRLIIGVHDLQDVVGGYIIGFLLLVGYMLLEPKISRVKIKLSVKIMVGVAIWFTVWVAGILIFPVDAEGFGLSCGLLIGISIGMPLELKLVDYRPEKLKPVQRILAGLIGVAITMGIYFALSLTLGEITSGAYFWRLMRYLILAVVVSLLIPWIFKKTFKN